MSRSNQPMKYPMDDGRFVAVNIETGDFEIDASDYAAVMRRRARSPGAELWLERAGDAAAVQVKRCQVAASRQAGP